MKPHLIKLGAELLISVLDAVQGLRAVKSVLRVAGNLKRSEVSCY